jgi:acetyltransferase-like isoleucine patch superfamily enzyme
MNPIIRHIGIVDVRFGEGVTVIEPVNLYHCMLGDHVFIGPFVEIQRDVRIICEMVTIGESCFIAHGVMFVNDDFSTGGPAADKSKWKPTRLGDRVAVGSNATILPVTICDDVVIGAGAVVTRDITIPGFYAGTPARLLRRR